MKEITVTVKFKEGLHARPATKLVKTASSMKSSIMLEKNGKKIAANSIMAVLGACIVYGDQIIVRAEGEDEEDAIQAMQEYFA